MGLVVARSVVIALLPLGQHRVGVFIGHRLTLPRAKRLVIEGVPIDPCQRQPREPVPERHPFARLDIAHDSVPLPGAGRRHALTSPLPIDSRNGIAEDSDLSTRQNTGNAMNDLSELVRPRSFSPRLPAIYLLEALPVARPRISHERFPVTDADDLPRAKQ